MLGLPVVVAHDDVISLFVAHGKGCEFLPTYLHSVLGILSYQHYLSMAYCI